MNNKKTHIYFVPGLAADKEIFENISLPENLYTLHIISWLIPSKKETIAQYAKRMAGFVTEKNAVLVGVSFGGVVAQEMNSFLKLKKLIIISSIKTKHELPTKFKIAKNLRFYKLIPTRLVSKLILLIISFAFWLIVGIIYAYDINNFLKRGFIGHFSSVCSIYINTHRF